MDESVNELVEVIIGRAIGRMAEMQSNPEAFLDQHIGLTIVDAGLLKSRTTAIEEAPQPPIGERAISETREASLQRVERIYARAVEYLKRAGKMA